PEPGIRRGNLCRREIGSSIGTDVKGGEREEDPEPEQVQEDGEEDDREGRATIHGADTVTGTGRPDRRWEGWSSGVTLSHPHRIPSSTGTNGSAQVSAGTRSPSTSTSTVRPGSVHSRRM